MNAEPMASPDANVSLVYNGEFFNYSELRDGAHCGRRCIPISFGFAATSYSLAELRERMVGHLNGMSAFAIQDRRKQTLICAIAWA
jgi:asparagine synthase (glutamine-hydrolysing)